MRKIVRKIRNFFLVPATAPLYIRLAPFVFMGALTTVLVIGGVAGWNYTNSTAFCGTTCHTMPPEYSSYLSSPHARVECWECHLGRDTLTRQLPRKIAHSETAYAILFHTYEYPIVAKKMRPATEACETCHYPNKFSNDSVQEIRTYADDEKNSFETIYLILKTGGGTKRQGLGLGIHWHIENKVSFLATDEMQQNIPYVRVEDENGKITEYYDVSSGVGPEDVAGKYLVTMDCITCHNRTAHSIPAPTEAVAQALTKGLIPNDLPYINKQAVALLSVSYPNQQAAFAAIDGLMSYYAKYYPQLYSQQPEKIQKAIDTLKDIYPQEYYPEQDLDYTTHPDNLGHIDSPGCFRCHDGKHLTSSGEAIRLECNLCHSIPTVSNSSKFVTNLEIVRGPEPASHTETNWMALHGKVIDPTCATCHPPTDPATDYTKLQGKPPLDGSFCGNSECHGTEWTYAAFNSPALYSILDNQIIELKAAAPTQAPIGNAPVTYENTFKAIFANQCSSCHQGANGMGGLDLSTYAGAVKGTKDGPGIDPGNPDNSLIFKIQSAGNHYGQLAAAEIDTLKQWIAGGAPEK
ncbi:MAG: NapC/NirT family cytochrome c [Chloroflexi bacterium]|nr:NapC/NirT family cytochrome c [Chloroflexota bacterium]